MLLVHSRKKVAVIVSTTSNYDGWSSSSNSSSSSGSSGNDDSISSIHYVLSDVFESKKKDVKSILCWEFVDCQ